MLIEYGNTVVKPNWRLMEDAPTGYARIYYVLEGDLTYEAAEDGYYLHLPMQETEKVQVSKGTDEQVLRLDKAVRRIPLPGTLRGWAISEVIRQEERLSVLFREKNPGGERTVRPV